MPKTAVRFVFLSAFTLLFFLAAGTLRASQSPGNEQQRFETHEETKNVEHALTTELPPVSIEVEKEAVKPHATSAEEAHFFIEKIIVTGNTVISTEAIRKVTASYEGKELTLPQCRLIADGITQLYLARGFITSRAYVPPQKLDAKTLEIRVLEGRLGQAQVRGNRFFRKENLLNRVQKWREQVIEYSGLFKEIAQMNLHPDREVKAVIVPGKGVGTSDLLLDVNDRFPFHVGAEVNNYGTKLTGLERYNVSARHTNLLGLDDILAGRVQWGNLVKALGLQYLLPVGNYDTKIGASFNYTEVSIGGNFTSLDIAGTAYDYSVLFNQPLLDTQHLDLTWTGSLEFKDINNTVLDQTFSTDRLRLLHTGINIDEMDRFGRTFIVNDCEFGTTGLNGSDKNDPNLSRAGSGADFFKYTGSLNRVHPVYDSTLLYMKATAQWTRDGLVSAEQYDNGGIYSVRGYPQSDYQGDLGAGGSVELRVPCYFIPRDLKVPRTDVPLWNKINAVVFFDGEYAKLRKPAPGENTSKSNRGVGGGFRFDLPHNLTGSFLWAAPIGDRPTDTSRSQFYFSISGDFF